MPITMLRGIVVGLALLMSAAHRLTPSIDAGKVFVPDEAPVDAATEMFAKGNTARAAKIRLFGRKECLNEDHGKPVSWDGSVGSKVSPGRPGVKCHGVWSPWTACTEQCYRNRTFNLTEAVNCPDGAVWTGEIEYSLCTTGQCRFANQDLGKGFREAIFRHGLASKNIENLGVLLSQSQVWILLMITVTICVVAFAKSLKIEWLPDMCVAIPISAGFALFLRFHTLQGVNFDLALNSVFGTLVSRVMNDFLIPISIFEGAYHVQRKNFLSQFAYGLLFAVVGTIFSTVLIASMVKYSGEWGLHPVDSWRESYAYAAFIADVDPVATLAIFGNLKADALLSTMVAGEATLNDPIAIVIFKVCNQRASNMDFDLSKEAVKGLILLNGSIVMGLLAGLMFTAFIRIARLRGQEALETGYVFLSAYFGYALGEFVGMSGIIVTLFSGLMMGIFVPRVVEDTGSVDKFLNCAARIADLIMFSIIGFSAFMIDDPVGVQLGLLTILFCLIARAIMIATLVPLVNMVKSHFGVTTLNFGTAFMMWHSGFRGGMTVMMALMVDQYWSKNQNCLVNATLVCVTGLAYLCGMTGPFFLRLCNVPMNVPQEDGSLLQGDVYSNTRSTLNKLDSSVSSMFGLAGGDHSPAESPTSRRISEDQINED